MILKRKFYERETVIVAKQLLGKKLTQRIGMKDISGIITETDVWASWCIIRLFHIWNAFHV